MATDPPPLVLTTISTSTDLKTQTILPRLPRKTQLTPGEHPLRVPELLHVVVQEILTRDHPSHVKSTRLSRCQISILPEKC
jgi:hypothetical protein